MPSGAAQEARYPAGTLGDIQAVTVVRRVAFKLSMLLLRLGGRPAVGPPVRTHFNVRVVVNVAFVNVAFAASALRPREGVHKQTLHCK